MRRLNSVLVVLVIAGTFLAGTTAGWLARQPEPYYDGAVTVYSNIKEFPRISNRDSGSDMLRHFGKPRKFAVVGIGDGPPATTAPREMVFGNNKSWSIVVTWVPDDSIPAA